jgi:hypothetical protein
MLDSCDSMKQSDVSIIRGFINTVHMFVEDMLIATEGINNVLLRTCCDEKLEIGRKVRNANTSRRTLQEASSALSSRALIMMRIGLKVVGAFTGSRMKFLNCSVAESVV